MIKNERSEAQRAVESALQHDLRATPPCMVMVDPPPTNEYGGYVSSSVGMTTRSGVGCVQFVSNSECLSFTDIMRGIPATIYYHKTATRLGKPDFTLRRELRTTITTEETVKLAIPLNRPTSPTYLMAMFYTGPQFDTCTIAVVGIVLYNHKGEVLLSAPIEQGWGLHTGANCTISVSIPTKWFVANPSSVPQLVRIDHSQG